MQQLRVEFQPKGIASSKSPRWEHKLEVSKTQQEEQGMRGSGGGGGRVGEVGRSQVMQGHVPCFKVWSKDQQHQHHQKVC